jgi:hypothetical protein
MIKELGYRHSVVAGDRAGGSLAKMSRVALLYGGRRTLLQTTYTLPVIGIRASIGLACERILHRRGKSPLLFPSFQDRLNV